MTFLTVQTRDIVNYGNGFDLDIIRCIIIKFLIVIEKSLTALI